MEARERNAISFETPPQSNQGSSSRLTSATLNPPTTSNSRRNEAPDHLHHLYQKHHSHGGFRFHQEQLQEAQRPRREPNPDLDPAQTVSLTPPQPQLPPQPRTLAAVRYRECLKNHAANMGAHVLDGCGEFMPSGEEGTPEALKCAACECHRSFHRREVEGEPQPTYYTQNPASRIPAIHNQPSRPADIYPLTAQYVHKNRHPVPPIMMAFGGASGTPAESSSEDLNIFRTNVEGQMMGTPSKKRFRTKFSQEQKNKMYDFAEKIGWKIQKQDEQEVLQFCSDVGLKKQVFKVWMHNNKQAMKKKQHYLT